jgi:lipoprotein-anchoring transpeptidase ErfK/SrfK
MARSSSRSARNRRRQTAGRLYLAGAVIVFAVVVFLLFRGDSSVPDDDVAGAADTTVAREPERATPRLAAAANPQLASASPDLPAEAPPQEFPQETPSRASQSAAVAPPAQSLPVTPAGMAPEPPTDAGVDAAVANAMALLQTRPRQVIAARDKLNETLSLSLTAAQRQAVKTQMAKLSEEWLFGPAAFAGDALCETYRVKRGDVLQVIGRRNKVPYEALMKINSIRRPESLQAGKAMKIVKGPFHAKVYRSTFTLDLYLRDTYVRSFKVGLGKPGYETPTGLWRVQEGGKLKEPTWTDPDTQRVYKATDPDYPLGSRWIALDGVSGDAKGRTGFAIHGTKSPEQIGMAGSRGCIRMFNGEAIQVYNLLFPLYSKVEVLD